MNHILVCMEVPEVPEEKVDKLKKYFTQVMGLTGEESVEIPMDESKGLSEGVALVHCASAARVAELGTLITGREISKGRPVKALAMNDAVMTEFFAKDRESGSPASKKGNGASPASGASRVNLDRSDVYSSCPLLSMADKSDERSISLVSVLGEGRVVAHTVDPLGDPVLNSTEVEELAEHSEKSALNRQCFQSASGLFFAEVFAHSKSKTKRSSTSEVVLRFGQDLSQSEVLKVDFKASGLGFSPTEEYLAVSSSRSALTECSSLEWSRQIASIQDRHHTSDHGDHPHHHYHASQLEVFHVPTSQSVFKTSHNESVVHSSWVGSRYLIVWSIDLENEQPKCSIVSFSSVDASVTLASDLSIDLNDKLTRCSRFCAARAEPLLAIWMDETVNDPAACMVLRLSTRKASDNGSVCSVEVVASRRIFKTAHEPCLQMVFSECGEYLAFVYPRMSGVVGPKESGKVEKETGKIEKDSSGLLQQPESLTLSASRFAVDVLTVKAHQASSGETVFDGEYFVCDLKFEPSSLDEFAAAKEAKEGKSDKPSHSTSSTFSSLRLGLIVSPRGKSGTSKVFKAPRGVKADAAVQIAAPSTNSAQRGPMARTASIAVKKDSVFGQTEQTTGVDLASTQSFIVLPIGEGARSGATAGAGAGGSSKASVLKLPTSSLTSLTWAALGEFVAIHTGLNKSLQAMGGYSGCAADLYFCSCPRKTGDDKTPGPSAASGAAASTPASAALASGIEVIRREEFGFLSFVSADPTGRFFVTGVLLPTEVVSSTDGPGSSGPLASDNSAIDVRERPKLFGKKKKEVPLNKSPMYMKALQYGGFSVYTVQGRLVVKHKTENGLQFLSCSTPNVSHLRAIVSEADEAMSKTSRNGNDSDSSFYESLLDGCKVSNKQAKESISRDDTVRSSRRFAYKERMAQAQNQLDTVLKSLDQWFESREKELQAECAAGDQW